MPTYQRDGGDAGEATNQASQGIQLALPAAMDRDQDRVDWSLADGPDRVGDAFPKQERKPARPGRFDATALLRAEDRRDEGWAGDGGGWTGQATLLERSPPS
jgi:hypothetical protein